MELCVESCEAHLAQDFKELDKQAISSTEDEQKFICCLSLLGAAFNYGLVPCKRVLEVVVGLFLRLANPGGLASGPMANAPLHLQKIFQDLFLNTLLITWYTSLQEILRGRLVGASDGGVLCIPILTPEKRAELVLAMRKAKVLQVRSMH